MPVTTPSWDTVTRLWPTSRGMAARYGSSTSRIPARAPRAAGRRPGGRRHDVSDRDLVFSSRTGAAVDAANVRREFRAVCRAAGIGGNWTPRELRHSFVSLISSTGVPVEEIARLAGHASSRTTEVVYRRELRPVLTTGAEAMDRLFKVGTSQ